MSSLMSSFSFLFLLIKFEQNSPRYVVIFLLLFRSLLKMLMDGTEKMGLAGLA